jgi:hypothetical protein
MQGEEHMTQEALKRVAEKLRRTGASIPAPEVTGTIEGPVVTGLCIALALVEGEIDALAQEKALQTLHNENERLGLYKDAYEQEPVAWIHNFIEGGISIGKRPADLSLHPDRWTALYKDPKPCPTCEALARTVMLDQTSHDTTPPQRTWVGLKEEDYVLVNQLCINPIQAAEFVDRLLKERNQ